jgi:hypothetical protein
LASLTTERRILVAGLSLVAAVTVSWLLYDQLTYKQYEVHEDFTIHTAGQIYAGQKTLDGSLDRLRAETERIQEGSR